MEKPNNEEMTPLAASNIVPPSSSSLVQQLIHERAILHPNAEAVCSHDCILTYHALDTVSSQLAHRLVEEDGVGPEVIVPLLFEKSGWALVAMLAVLKAGGAFMPLDISQPESRLRSIVEQTAAKVALSSHSCHALSSSLAKKSVIVTEETITITGTNTSPRLPPPPHPHNAAYVMATSGSTGTPKLVITEHAQLSSFVAYLTQPLNFTSKTRTFQFASYAFDPIIGDIFLTLSAGGTVCIPSEDERRNDIVGAIQRMRVTLAKFTPSLVHSLLDTLTPQTVPLLKTLVLGGEMASREVIKAWADKVDLKLVYGSTECTISCVVEHVNPSRHGTLPGEIGRPIGSLAWVVDPENLDLVEDGQVGELVLGGPLISRGYMNNPSQTEAKYIKPTEWSRSKTSRLYRTGDLVRRLPADGRLVYDGRMDNQVKIRGQRLELEDVEQHVSRALSNLSSPRIRTKSVLVDYVAPTGETDKQLVGILSLHVESTSSGSPVVGRLGSLVLTGEDIRVDITESSQREFGLVVGQLEGVLKSLIPSYMVPTLWIPINDMPFTLSRKRDRQRLRRAVQSLPLSTLASFSRAKRIHHQRSQLSEQERLLQHVWSKVLGNKIRPEEIGPADDFFHVGGTSLSVLRLVSMVRKTTDYCVTADEVFGYPKLADLASRLTLSLVESNQIPPFGLIEISSLADIRREAAQQCGVGDNALEDILPLYSMQHHYITGYPELERNINGPWNWQQQIVFKLPPGFDTRRFRSVWSELVNEHAQLRTRVVNTSHGLFQVVLSPALSPLNWREADNLDTYVQRDRTTVMTFGDELLRLGMVGESGGSSYFVLTMQHLIYDAYSRDLLFTLLESRYQHQEPASNLQQSQPNMRQFINYVTKDTIRQSAIKFWTSYLQGAEMKPLLSQPLGSRPVRALQFEKMTISRPEIPPSSGITLATVIEVSAALAIAHLQCHEAQESGSPPKDILFYSDRAGRNLPVEGISDLMAPATLFLPLRVSIDPSQSVRELLSMHQAASKEMILYEHMNWTELRELGHLKDVLLHSVNININPYTPLTRLGRNMGLQVVDEYEKCDDPFGINVSVWDDELEWVVYFDEEFISRDKVLKLMGLLRKMFDLVVLESRKTSDDSGGLTLVGDVL